MMANGSWRCASSSRRRRLKVLRRVGPSDAKRRLPWRRRSSASWAGIIGRTALRGMPTQRFEGSGGRRERSSAKLSQSRRGRPPASGARGRRVDSRRLPIRSLLRSAPMNYRSLGNSGLKISEIALGSWTTFGGYADDAEAIRIVRRAFELGINLFDTADVYVRGGAETLLGKALTGLPREQLVIATKVMGRVWDGPLGAGLSRKHIFDAMDQSLKRLGIDYVDLYQAHAPHAESPIEETLRAFEDLVRMGKTRYVGFSNFDREPALAQR